jgi:Ser/Thr protein kinase RdoA (MazF antagonist)
MKGYPLCFAADIFGARGGRAVLTGSFESLSPDAAVRAVENAHGLVLDGTLESYSSYVNRVYGVRGEDGARLVVKFYRPGRWSREAILDEHRFLLDLKEEEIPVIAPLAGTDGETLHETVVEGDDGRHSFLFALFPRVGGRTFEPETADDRLRLGALLGRMHAVGSRREAPHRVVCAPDTLSASYVEELLADGLVHPSCREDFAAQCAECLGLIAPLFSSAPMQRIHGDCHRGNIIDRPDTGLALIDFDDMMSGPQAQDIWLVLPDHVEGSRRELAQLLEGYEQFASFPRDTLALVEPLRFMRMLYFLVWRARQRGDYWFQQSFPDWGGEAFWLKETEDLRTQLALIKRAM